MENQEKLWEFYFHPEQRKMNERGRYKLHNFVLFKKDNQEYWREYTERVTEGRNRDSVNIFGQKPFLKAKRFVTFHRHSEKGWYVKYNEDRKLTEYTRKELYAFKKSVKEGEKIIQAEEEKHMRRMFNSQQQELESDDGIFLHELV